MSNDSQDFERFMKRREDAARAFVNGDVVSLNRISARTSPVSFFGPKGGHEQGAEQVSAAYQRDAARFDSGETHFEILHMHASDGIGYWVGFQKATARLKGSADAVPFDLRVTEVFRREDGDWKLIHRHADTLAAEAGGRK